MSSTDLFLIALVAKRLKSLRTRVRALEQAPEPPPVEAEPGPKGDTGPMPKHQWDGTKLRFQQEPGKWGKWTDLKGDGAVSIGGGWSPYSIAPYQGGEPEKIVVRENGRWVQATVEEAQGWFGGGGNRHIDGGAPDSVHTADQRFDGGVI